MSGFITVHLRVNDAATNQPTPVRLRIAGPNGENFVPFGRSPDFPLGRNEAVGGHVYLGGRKFVYIDGACEIRLPTGTPLDFDISKGIEYEPIREAVTLGSGQMSLRFTIRRWFDRHEKDWISADTRCHSLSPHDALLEGAAEDIDFVHLLVTEHDQPANDGHLYRTVPNISAFSGQRPCVESNGHAVIVNTFNTHPVLGHLSLLHSHRPVHPLSFGEVDGTDDWSLCDWCDQCHRKGGLTVWSDAFRPESGLLGGEALIALILGKIDALEFDASERTLPFLPLYYRLLNAGVRVPLVGSSGKTDNRTAIGSCRTYTVMPKGETSLAAWIEQTRLGHSFVTNGPLLDISVTVAEDVATVHARARSLNPFDKLELVANGEVIAATTLVGKPYEATLVQEVKRAGNRWIAARCRGGRSELYPPAPVFAHTSPVRPYFPAKESETPDRKSLAFIRQLINETRTWIEEHGRFQEPKRRVNLLEMCDLADKAVNT